MVDRCPASGLVTLVAVGLVAAAPATAKEWRAPDDRPGTQSGGDTTRALIDELRQFIERGEKERLADPWYLRDLRAMVDRYDWPWRVRLLSEDFSERGSRPPPPWQVSEGEFLIDWRFGMRSLVEPPRPTAPSQPSQKQDQDDGSAVQNLLGSLLKQTLGGQQTAKQAKPARLVTETDAGRPADRQTGGTRRGAAGRIGLCRGIRRGRDHQCLRV